MKMTDSELILLNMLRQKQYKLDIYYLTTDSIFYKAIHVIFYILFILCTIINVLCAISWSAQLSADLSILQNATTVQSQAAAEIRGGITTIVIFGAVIFAGPLFSKFEKSIPALCFSLIPAAVLLYTFYDRLSEAISTGHYSFFIFVHLLPLGLFMLCSIILAAIEISQKVLDKKGMEEIATRIYKKYSVMADDISEAQWQEILNGYEKPEKKKKVRKN